MSTCIHSNLTISLPLFSHAHIRRDEEVRAFRRRMRIVVKGEDVPDPLVSFDQLELPEGSDHVRRILLRNIEESGT